MSDVRGKNRQSRWVALKGIREIRMDGKQLIRDPWMNTDNAALQRREFSASDSDAPADS